jgi:hypothetical protein
MNPTRIFPLCLLCLLSLLPTSPGLAQPRVDNVRFSQQGDQVIITYDLLGSARVYTITLELSTDDGRTYTQTPKTLLGDVGDKVRPGRSKQIVWEAMQDAKGLAGCCIRVVSCNPGSSAEAK